MNVISSIEVPKEFLNMQIKSKMYKEFLAIQVTYEDKGDKVIYIY